MPVFILVFYGGFINCLRLVTYCLSTVYIAVFICALGCIFIKMLHSSNYLISYLSHFSPSRVNTNFELETLAFEETEGSGSLAHYYKEYRKLQLLARMVSRLEMIGTAIRPISLSLRLVANMSCGHILMCLFARGASFIPLCSAPCVFICGLETLVCFVQCYVFYTLWCMYMGE